jgi:aminoglycoside 6'-N-acetyltransferase I
VNAGHAGWMRVSYPIRAATNSDLPELVRLFNALFPDNSEEEHEITRYLAGKVSPGVILVAERAQGLAGFVEVATRPYAEGCESSPVAYIEAWYVDADVRRAGVGRALVAAAEAWARAQNFTEIASDALTDNHVSIAAHRALGYEEVERIVCFRRSLER